MAELTTNVKLDATRFNASFRHYVKNTDRDGTTAINKKMFWVGVKAIRHTEKADRNKMRNELGAKIRNFTGTQTKSGRTRFGHRLSLPSPSKGETPLAALIVLRRRMKRGDGWADWRGSEMQREIGAMLGARYKSIAYTKSGFLPGVRELAKFVPGLNTSTDRDAQQIGKAKGSGEAARSILGTRNAAKIVNEAFSRRDSKNTLVRVGGAGLQKAMDDEAAYMETYLEKELKPAADTFNASQR
jgi:hypothetical protein